MLADSLWQVCAVGLAWRTVAARVGQDPTTGALSSGDGRSRCAPWCRKPRCRGVVDPAGEQPARCIFAVFTAERTSEIGARRTGIGAAA